jgi:tetratricopeptide (TPR) repeat protein
MAQFSIAEPGGSIMAANSSMRSDSEDNRREQALALLRMAFEHQSHGELDEAIELYRQSLAACPTAEGHTFLGWAYSFQGRWDDAIAECLKAIEVDPTFGNPYNDIGAYLIEQEKLEEAIHWFERALRAPRYENYCFPHFNLGRVYEKKRLFGRALEEYNLAVRENPAHQGARRAAQRLQAMLN